MIGTATICECGCSIPRCGRALRWSVSTGPAPDSDLMLYYVECPELYDRPGNLDRAISLLTQSVKTEPASALAFASLGQAYCLKASVAKDRSLVLSAEANAAHALAGMIGSVVERLLDAPSRPRFIRPKR